MNLHFCIALYYVCLNNKTISHNQTFASSVGKINGKMQRVDKFSKADTAFDFVLFIRISSSAAYRKFAFRLIPKMVTNRVWPGGQRGMYSLSLSMSQRGTHTFKVEPYLTRSLKRKKTTHLFYRSFWKEKRPGYALLFFQ